MYDSLVHMHIILWLGFQCVVIFHSVIANSFALTVERTSATLQSTARDAAYQIGTKLKEYRTMLEMYGDSVIQARWDNVSELLPESCFSWGLWFAVGSIYYTNSSECGLGLTSFITDHLYPGDPGYSEMTLGVRNLMLGQTTYPNDLALSFMSKYSINAVGSVTLEGVVRMTPWWNMMDTTSQRSSV
ncbi:hypothetical protein Pelo_17562 [Pelomyxa schiedti]|nr:hypothetical protein Pelo_17562 [Pelomyxa schiedti]